MKKFLLTFSILLSFLLIFAITPIITVDAADSDFPPMEQVSGWYTFTNVNSINISNLYWDYGYQRPDEVPQYPSTDTTSYTINISFALESIVTDDTLTDALGNPLNYTLAKKIVIIKASGNQADIAFVFTNPGVGVEEQYVLVYGSETGWVNDTYKHILISSVYIPTDFIQFLNDNGIFNYIRVDDNRTDVTDLIITFVDIPTRIMHGMLDINVMGTTLFVIVVGIITIVFIVYLFKRIL